MMSKIRLADRRGLLSGRSISPVQSDALEVLILRELYEANRVSRVAAEDKLAQRKLAVMTHGLESIKQVFPQWLDPSLKAPSKTADEPVAATLTVEEAKDLSDEVASEWQHVGPTPSPDEVEALLAKLGGGGTGTVDGLGPDEDGWI